MTKAFCTARRGLLCLVLVAAVWGCSKREEASERSSVPGAPSDAVLARVAANLANPAKRALALKELDDVLRPIEARESAGSDDAVLALLAERTAVALVTASKTAPVPGGERFLAVELLRRLGPHARDADLRKRVVEEAFLPALRRFSQKGEDPAEASAAVDGVLLLVIPLGGVDPTFGPEGVFATTSALADAAQSIRQRWGCTDWHSRAEATPPPAAAGGGATARPAVRPTDLLVSCLRGIVRLLDRSQGAESESLGVAVLSDALRESTKFQDPAVHLAAAESLEPIAQRLTPAAIRELATALVEALFAGEESGDGRDVQHAARRLLSRLASVSPENRDIVVEELLKALVLDLEPETLTAFPLLAALGKNVRFDLMRLPCGGGLGVVCQEGQDALVAYRDQAGASPEQAACNVGLKPDDPQSGFRWGFEHGTVWDRIARALVDVLPPQPAGMAPDPATRKGLALEVLRAQLRSTLAWTEQVEKARQAGATAELEALFDKPHGGLAVTLRWWRTVPAVRALALLGVSGPDDETLRLALRLARFVLERGAGFRVAPDAVFPEIVLGTLRPRAAAGPGPEWPGEALFEAIADFQRPTPEVLGFLLHVLTVPGLVGESATPVTRAGRYLAASDRISGARAAAAHAFLRLYRGDAPDAAARLDLLRFFLEDLQPLLALQQGDPAVPPFQLYPPAVAKGVERTRGRGEPEDEWAVEPARPDDFNFSTYRDALAACAWRSRENPGHVAKWQGELTAEQKTLYCRKWVEPFATESATELRDVEVEKLELSDERCWTHMAQEDARQFRFCDDTQAGRTPVEELGLSNEQCEKVLAREDERRFCAELRFVPLYPVQGRPSLWACYERFPSLRLEEPIGPACPHLASRILAAYLYVKLRSEAPARTRDDVTFESLEAILPLRDYLSFVRTFGETPDPAVLAKVDQLTTELARVELDLPVFRAPPSPALRIARRTERRPDELTVPDVVPTPWHRRDGFFARPRLTLADLRTDFLAACGAPQGDVPPTACAPDGAGLGASLRLAGPDGAPGALQAGAVSLAAMLVAENLPGLFQLPAVIEAVDGRCLVGGTYTVSCLRDAAEQDVPGGFSVRERALFLLTAFADRDRVLAERTLMELIPAAETDARLVMPLSFALVKLRPVCAGPPDGPCDPKRGCASARCDRVRLSGAALAVPSPTTPIEGPPPAPPPAAPPETPPEAADAGTDVPVAEAADVPPATDGGAAAPAADAEAAPPATNPAAAPTAPPATP